MEFDYQKQPGRERIRYYAPNPEDALVSVITPYYNAGAYFEQTFNAVMNQTFPWFEWVIVDDGSTNAEDVEILHRFAAQDPRIRMVTQENGGLSCARNTGIANARTELVVPLDADDLIDATYLEYLYWSLHFHPEAAWSYCDTVGFQEREYLWKKPFDSEALKKDNFLVATAMMRKKDVDQVGGYKVENGHYFEDWRFWLDMLALEKKPVHVGSPMFWYRRLDKGMLSSVVHDEERVKFCQNIIQETARKVRTTVRAAEYPVAVSKQIFHTPQMIQWDRKITDTKTKKRVMWLVPWLNMGGADKFNLDAIAGLKEQGIENYIVTTLASDNVWKQKFEEHTDEIFCLADFLDPAHFAEFISYFIQSRDIDVIMLSNSYDGYYMMPWLRQQFPEVAIVDYVHMEEWYWRRGGFARISGMMSCVTEKTYVCNSGTRDVLTSCFGRDPETVETLYIGVDEVKFDRENVEPGRLYHELGVAEDRPVVLFICRLHPQKRPFMMLEIAKRVQKQLPEAIFAVVGDGPQEKELQEKAKAMGLEDTVRFLGAKKDVRPYYRDAKLTLVCSLKEGLSLTAYESCAMGVPVVSSDVGGQRDLVDNTTGALLPCLQEEGTSLDSRVFPEEELKSFTDAIVHLLTDKEAWEAASHACRERIEAGFTIQKMVDRLAAELTWLTEDPVLAQKRSATAQHLQQLEPLAAEMCVSAMETKRQEALVDDLWRITQQYKAMYAPVPEQVTGYYVESLSQKIRRVWKTEGFGGLIKKAIRKIIRVWREEGFLALVKKLWAKIYWKFFKK